MQKAYIINGFADNSYLGLEDVWSIGQEIKQSKNQFQEICLS